jgi:hypothetical protein
MYIYTVVPGSAMSERAELAQIDNKLMMPDEYRSNIYCRKN